MNPLTLIGETFSLAGRQGGRFFGINWWVIILLAAGLTGLSYLSLRLFELLPRSMGIGNLQAAGISVALAPHYLTLLGVGLMAGRYIEKSGGFPVLRQRDGRGRFPPRWIFISTMMYVAFILIEIVYARLLEGAAQGADPALQGVLYMLRNYAMVMIFVVGLCFLVAAQNLMLAARAAEKQGWMQYAAIMVAGFVIYFVVETAIEQILLYLPPIGFFWATLDRLQPPYFFLTETARIAAQTLSAIIYALFIVVAGEAAKR